MQLSFKITKQWLLWYCLYEKSFLLVVFKLWPLPKSVLSLDFWAFGESQSLFINKKCFHHIKTSQLVCSANQLTGFYMMAILVDNGNRHTDFFFFFTWPQNKHVYIVVYIICFITCQSSGSHISGTFTFKHIRKLHHEVVITFPVYTVSISHFIGFHFQEGALILSVSSLIQ